MAAVVERTVLYDVVLRPVDAPAPKVRFLKASYSTPVVNSLTVCGLRPGSASVASPPRFPKSRERGGARRTVQPAGVDVEVGLHQVAASAHVDIEQDRRLREARIVGEEFASSPSQ